MYNVQQKYHYPSSHTSLDINECDDDKGGCNQTCVNIKGSYYCTCERGFQRYEKTECEGNDTYYQFL